MEHNKAILRQFVQDAWQRLRPVWPLVVCATGLGSVGGLATAAALVKINEAFYGVGQVANGVLFGFVGYATVGLGGTFGSSVANAFVSGRIRTAVSQDLIDRVLTAPIEQMERMGKHRVLSSLLDDVRSILEALTFISPLVVAIGTLIGCAAYMFVLSPTLSAITAAVLVLGSLAENIMRKNLDETIDKARLIQETTQKNYLNLTEAAKELRIGRPRRLHLRNNQLRDCLEQGRHLVTRFAILIQTMSIVSQLTNFVLFGGLIAYKIAAGTSGIELSGFVLVLLYIQGPISKIVQFLPVMSEAKVAYLRIAEFAGETGEVEPDLLTNKPPTPSAIAAITLRAVCHAFPAADDRATFTLGPIDLTLRAGEILFIVGENGSGKTTLIKLLLGLYPPQHGQILLDGVPVTTCNRDDYRQLFSVIFFDYHLFEDLIVAEGTSLETAAPFLERLDLAHKVAIADGRFTTVDLSTGQRKRLALVQAYIEGRPIMVLDEWAAEQDPTFRRVFYTELLPELKRQGRTLIVISHDDRYFGAADRVVHLRNGQIEQIIENAIVSV